MILFSNSKNSITWKLIFSIFVFSSLATLLATALHLYSDYSAELNVIEKRLLQIEDSHLQKISHSLQVSDADWLKAQLNEILQLPDIQYLEIISQEKSIRSAGMPKIENTLSREFPLSFSFNGQNVDLGKLRIVVSLENLYQRLFKRVFVIMGTEALKMSLVSIFIFFIVQWLIIRRLIRITDYINRRKPTGLIPFIDSGQSLTLSHQPFVVSSPDELDQVVIVINDWQEKFKQNLDAFFKVEKTLRQSEKRFRAIFEQASVGVALIESQTGNFVQINQKYCDIVGYTLDEMVTIAFMQITHPDDLLLDLENMERLKAGEIREFSMEKRYFHKNGSIVWVQLNVSAMWAVDQAPDYHIAIVEDITRRKQAEAALKQYREQLEIMVEERTKELEEKNAKLTKMNELFVGREFRIKELREQIKILEQIQKQ
ncbi:MAG: PAS domain S-box protein [SAR324 cluster bacterium]|nr:PAS domain S-box protein [SAR324 cluster bacterium]